MHLISLSTFISEALLERLNVSAASFKRLVKKQWRNHLSLHRKQKVNCTHLESHPVYILEASDPLKSLTGSCVETKRFKSAQNSDAFPVIFILYIFRVILQ